MDRRDWLKRVGATSAIALPTKLLGKTDSVYDHAVRRLVGGASIKPNSAIAVHLPEQAANGAVVPVGVVSSLPDTLKIVLLVDNHVRSIVASMDTSNSMLAPRLSTHLQLTSAATITALVKTKQGWYSNFAQVKTLGESC